MKRRFEVTVWVNVEVDETKFTEQFMEEFRESFYPFRTLDRHMQHLAQLEARGLTEDFIEGYGPVEEMGIKTETLEWDVEVV